ncbi:hypothetical protein RRG08_035550 [Elysia crispata]|uniref:Uncharacterized protein n=1 Tax=Elysia crispata TaxID=231223 RepID=A0AAE1E9J9_9GAST|nr:hypothetical protein RRG08_035550 [Elysia crispata]
MDKRLVLLLLASFDGVLGQGRLIVHGLHSKRIIFICEPTNHFAKMKTAGLLVLAIFLIFAVTRIYAYDRCYIAYLGCDGYEEDDKFYTPWCCDNGIPTFTYRGDETDCECS